MVLCVMAMLSSGSLLARGTEQTPAEEQLFGPEFLRVTEHLRTLFDELRALPKMEGWTPADSEPLIGEIDRTITAYVLNRLNSSPTPTSETLGRQLNEVLVRAILGIPLKKLGKHAKSLAFACQEMGEQPSLYVVGFTIGYGHTTTNVIRAFVKEEIRYQAVAQTGEAFANRRLDGLCLRPFGEQEVRFLAYGNRIGNPMAPLKVVLFQFDAKSLQVLWQSVDLARGEVSLRDDRVIIKYWHDPYGKRTCRQETYEQVPEGLRLEKEEDRPFRFC